MYHVVKVTPDNHMKIIKWLTTGPAREIFRDAVGAFSEEKTYYVVVYITSTGFVSMPTFFSGNILEMPYRELVMITLD